MCIHGESYSSGLCRVGGTREASGRCWGKDEGKNVLNVNSGR